MSWVVKRLGLVICVLLAASLLIGVAKAEGRCDFADDTVLLGGVVPLSSPGSVAGGVGMKWGFEQAVADINAGCGITIDGANHRVDLVTADSEGVSEYGQ